jgi:hypothetical protein
VWFPDHFAQHVSAMFDCAIDPVTKVPYFRCAQVNINRLEASGERP